MTALLAAIGSMTLMAGFMVMGTTGAAQADSSPVAPNEHQIAICHATGAGTGGKYTIPYPTKKQIASDAGHKTGSGVHPGDIIPPFAAGGTGGSAWDAFAGQNWDETHQAIYRNGCGVPTDERVSPNYPYAEPPTCDLGGVLRVPAQPTGVVVTSAGGLDGAGPGQYTFTYEAAKDYILVGDDEITITVLPKLTGPQCDGSTHDECRDLPGDQPKGFECTKSPTHRSVSDQRLDCTLGYQTRSGTVTTTYAFNATSQQWVGTEGAAVWGDWVTQRALTADERAQLKCDAPPPPKDVCKNIDGVQATVPSGYTEKDGICTKIPPPPPPTDVCKNIPGDQATVPVGWTEKDGVCTPMTPPPPVTDICTNLDGIQPEVPEGYSLVDGLCEKDEIAPTETEKPKPTTKPTTRPPVVGPAEVGGTAGAVPTAVAAGLPGPIGTSTSSGSPLGQGLVAGGLLLLMLAGAMQLGRRERGAHEV